MVGIGEVAHYVDSESSGGECCMVVAGKMRVTWDDESVIAELCFAMYVMLMVEHGRDECGCL